VHVVAQQTRRPGKGSTSRATFLDESNQTFLYKVKVRSHRMKSLFHHCIAFVSSMHNERKIVAKKLIGWNVTLDAVLLK